MWYRSNSHSLIYFFIYLFIHSYTHSINVSETLPDTWDKWNSISRILRWPPMTFDLIWFPSLWMKGKAVNIMRYFSCDMLCIAMAKYMDWLSVSYTRAWKQSFTQLVAAAENTENLSVRRVWQILLTWQWKESWGEEWGRLLKAKSGLCWQSARN